MSQEIIDLDEDRTFTNMKSLKERDMMIDELNKKIRFIKFEHDKNTKALESEIQELKEKLQNPKFATYEQIVHELEQNLTSTENELLKYKEIETELKKQVYGLKSENSTLRNENEKLMKYKDLNKELEELRLLKQNFDELQTRIKETAIEAIMEKENELVMIREKASEMEAVSNAKIESLNKQINSLQDKLFKSGVFLRDSNEVSFEPSELDRVKEDKEKMQRDFEIERAELKERLEILTVEFEKELANFEQYKTTFEKEINDRAFQKLKEQLEASSKSEYNLIEELQKYDEQIKTYETQTKDYEKKLSQQEERHLKVVETYKRKVEELEKNIKLQTDEKKSQSKLEAQLNEIREDYENKLHENSNVIKSLEKLKEKDMQRILQLEGENKRLAHTIEILKHSIMNLENSKAEMEEKIKNTIMNYEEKIEEISVSAQRERAKSEIKSQKMSSKPSFVYKLSEESVLHFGTELQKGVDEYNSRPSIVSPTPQNKLSNELKDFNCEENWQSTDMKELLVDLASTRNAAKKKFDFPAIKVTDYENTKPATQPEIKPFSADLEKLAKIEKDLNDMKNENMNLKNEIKELKECLMLEIEKNRERESEITKNLQTRRRQTIEGLKLFPSNFMENMQLQNQGQGFEHMEKVIHQLENVSSEKKELENKYNKLKREYEEEKKFLEDELKHTEETAIDAKLKFAIIATEKDYFEHENKAIIQELKKKKVNLEYTDKNKNGGILGMLLCNCRG